jgi:hypothetical protein
MPDWSKVRRGFPVFGRYADAFVAVPGVVTGLLIIWGSKGDRFGLVMGGGIVVGAGWMGWEALRTITGRRK